MCTIINMHFMSTHLFWYYAVRNWRRFKHLIEFFSLRYFQINAKWTVEIANKRKNSWTIKFGRISLLILPLYRALSSSMFHWLLHLPLFFLPIQLKNVWIFYDSVHKWTVICAIFLSIHAGVETNRRRKKNVANKHKSKSHITCI